jgi:hypothetical protein
MKDCYKNLMIIILIIIYFIIIEYSIGWLNVVGNSIIRPT